MLGYFLGSPCMCVCVYNDTEAYTAASQFSLPSPRGVPAHMAGVKVGHVHLYRWQVILCDLIRQIQIQQLQ